MDKKTAALKLAHDYLLSKQIGAHIIVAIREALAEQPARQELVACAAPMACSGADKCVFSTSPPAQQQEPVATVIQFDGEKIIDASMEFFDKYPIGTELYTSPPNVPTARASKPWVGLTDEERALCVQATVGSGDAVQLMCAIEAKLREKNA